MPDSQITTMANYDFGAPNQGAKATGQISLSTSPPEDGDTFTLTDSAGNTQQFEYDNDDSLANSGAVAIDPGADLDEAVNNTADAINADPILINATADTGSDNVDLTQSEPVADGNKAITVNWNTGANVSKTDFSGGAGSKEDRRFYLQNGFDADTEPDRRDKFAKATPVEMIVQEGGRHTFRIDNFDSLNNNGANDMTASIEVSTPENPEKFTPVNAADHGNAVDGVTVTHKTYGQFDLVLHPKRDARVRLFITGGARGQLQVRNEGGLDPIVF